MVIFLQNPLQNEIGILFPQRLFVRHIEGKASKQAVFACFLSLIEQNVDTFFVLFEVLHHRRELLLISYLIDNQLYRGNNSYLSVPVPVVPIDFLAIPKPSFVYITTYISISYRIFRRGFCTLFFNWNNWNWNTERSIVITVTFFYEAPCIRPIMNNF